MARRDRNEAKAPASPRSRDKAGGVIADDLDLFLSEVADATPLADRDRVPPPRESERPRNAPASGASAGGRPTLAVERDGEDAWARARGVSDRQLGDLRRGELEPEAEIDLHGLTAEGAAESAISFALASVAAGRRCVLLITGRGLRAGGISVVKEAVLDALTDGQATPHIRALSTAARRHGGPGALYVALRRPRA